MTHFYVGECQLIQSGFRKGKADKVPKYRILILNLSNSIDLKVKHNLITTLVEDSVVFEEGDYLQTIKWRVYLMKILFFFFAMIAIYNYSDLKEYQRMAIIKTKKGCDKYGRKNTSF